MGSEISAKYSACSRLISRRRAAETLEFLLLQEAVDHTFVERGDRGLEPCLAGEQDRFYREIADGAAEFDTCHLRHVEVDYGDRHALVARPVVDHGAQLGKLQPQQAVAVPSFGAEIHVRAVPKVAGEVGVLARLPAQMLERRVGPGERLAGKLVAELEIEAFQKKRIVVENENGGRVVEWSRLDTPSTSRHFP